MFSGGRKTVYWERMGEVDASVFKRNISRVAFNPFVRNTRFLYPPKTSENQAVF